MCNNNTKNEKKNVYSVSLIPLYGTEELVSKVQHYLEEIYSIGSCRIVKSDILRFTTGDAKAVLEETVRGTDVFILVDVGNYSCKYKMFGQEVMMSPDEHYQNLKRTISAIGGKAARVNVISPLLYSGRQDRRIARESLDCAVALRELENINVDNIMAFDVHDSKVQNAIPFVGFDDVFPVYQVIKTIVKNYDDIVFDKEHTVFVSPDFGATNRNFTYSDELDLDMGIFYKRRSKSEMKNGKYVVDEHKYIGPDVKGKDVITVDDIICSGETILDVAKKMKEMGAKRVFVSATFALFTEGIEIFDKAYNDGLISAVFITNASYRRKEIKEATWYKEVDLTKYISYYIYCINQGESIAKILDPHKKIRKLFSDK